MKKATPKEIREAVEFMERLVILKSNRYQNLSHYGPVGRRPRENFVDYCLRVRPMFSAFGLKRLPLRKRAR